MNIDKYFQDGFSVIDNVLTDEDCSNIMEATLCDEVQKHFDKDPQGFNFHLLEATLKNQVFLKYACHPKIIELIRPILGNDILLQHSKLCVKMPGKRKGTIPWHQDFAYLPHTNTKLLTVMISINDFTEENGCMNMLRGGHKMGILNHRDNNGFEKGCHDTWDWQDQSNIVSVAPKKRGISIHHCLMPHMSKDNVTDFPRYGIAFLYRSRDAYQLSDEIWEDTGLVVSGKGHDEPVDITLENLNIPIIKSHRYSNLFGSSYKQVSDKVLNGELQSPFLKSPSTV